MREAPKATKQSIASLYNRVSGQYGQVEPRTSAVLGQVLVEEAQIEPGMRILDVGVGRGANLFPAGQALRGQGLAAGIDLAYEMARRTHREIGGAPLHCATFLACMDGERLGFARASFDLLLCGFAFFFLEPGLALPEFQRVLRPGGRLAISVAESGDQRWAWYEERLLAFHDRHHLPFFSGSRGVGERNRPAEIADALRVNQFRSVRITIRELEVEYPDASTWWQSKWTHGARYPLEHIPAHLLPAFQEEVITRAGQLELAERWRLACILAER
jgi:O-methyltransferase/aklanonic acid methyltransferase